MSERADGGDGKARIGREEKWDLQSPASLSEPGKHVARVLVIDDDPAILKVMREILEYAGHEVQTEGNALRALQHVRRQPFDVVITDLQMPVNGVVAVKELIDADPDTEVILLTGYPDSWLAQEALDYGARLCLAKPIDPRTILNVVHAVLSDGCLSD